VLRVSFACLACLLQLNWQTGTWGYRPRLLLFDQRWLLSLPKHADRFKGTNYSNFWGKRLYDHLLLFCISDFVRRGGFKRLLYSHICEASHGRSPSYAQRHIISYLVFLISYFKRLSYLHMDEVPHPIAIGFHISKSIQDKSSKTKVSKTLFSN